MAKASLRPPFDQLASDIIETFLAGHHLYRPDLPYPESHSDMQGGVEALLLMFDIKRRPIALEFKDLLPKREEDASK